MKRRNFIGLTVVAAAGAAVGGFVFLEDFNKLARKIIRKDTASLKIDEREFDKFFKEVEKSRTWDILFPNSHKQLIKWHYYADNGLFRLPYTTNYKTYRSQLTGTFLLSTDFFRNRMDASRPVKYVGLFDPYYYPCSNPFSNIYYPGV